MGILKFLRKPDFKNPKTKIITVLYAGLVMVFLVLLITGGIAATCLPGFCGFCHEMDKDVQSWQHSSHAKVNCIACHVEPGLIHLLKDKVMAVKSMYYTITSAYHGKTINAESELSHEVSAENCERCHSLENRKLTPSNGIIMNHEVHMEEEINCAQCHNRVAHVNLANYENHLEMEYCMHTCHNDEVAPRDCSKCHPENFDLIPKDHKEANWLRPTHADNAEEDRKFCQSCHLEKFCFDCHGMEMPHPEETFKKDHQKLGQDDPSKCRLCHLEENFCNNCHHQPPDKDKDWIPQHWKIVKEKGADDCFSCHDETYCSHCHVRKIH